MHVRYNESRDKGECAAEDVLGHTVGISPDARGGVRIAGVADVVVSHGVHR